MDPFRTLDTDTIVAALGAPRVAERDLATRAAFGLGVPVAQALLRAADPRPAIAARRTWTFIGIHLRRAVDELAARRRGDVEHAGTLATALRAIAGPLAVAVADDLAGGDAPVALALRQVTPLEAIDAACRQAGVRGALIGYRLATEPGAEPAWPACYEGPVRLRAVEARVERATDFVTTRARTHLRLRVDWEWPFAPVSPPRLVTDDPDAIVSDAVAERAGAEIAASLGGDLTRAPAPRARVEAVFRGRADEVAIPADGREVTAHGLALRVERVDAAGAVLAITAIDPGRARRDTGVLGVSSFVLCVGGDDDECLAQVRRVRTLRDDDGPITERWGLGVRDGFGPLAEVRLRVARGFVGHAWPVALPPIALP